LNSIVVDLCIGRDDKGAFENSYAVLDQGGSDFPAKVDENLHRHAEADTGLTRRKSCWKGKKGDVEVMTTTSNTKITCRYSNHNRDRAV
jgi:hypothetical protein